VQLLPDRRIRSLAENPSFRLRKSLSIEIQRGPLSGAEQLSKRLVDVAGATFGLVILTPLMVLSAIAVKLDSPVSDLQIPDHDRDGGRRDGDLLSDYAFRHHVKPGITGWAQVSGFRGETAQVEQMKGRVDCDLWYINNWSLALDLKILPLTCLELTNRRNAY
jgi:lipopolysaccharide/colanic/teichoic acid biosynthesis glycosyltransferase